MWSEPAVATRLIVMARSGSGVAANMQLFSCLSTLPLPSSPGQTYNLMPDRYFTYVLALLFTPDRGRVVLVRKTRPAWQAGKVNAPGGKVLPGETPAEATRREVREETGVDVEEWTEILKWDDPIYRMHVMRAVDAKAWDARTAEDQEVFLSDVRALPENVIDNIRWLIPLALDDEVRLPLEVRSAKPEGSGLTEPPPAATAR